MNNELIDENNLIIVGIYLLFFNNSARSLTVNDQKLSCIYAMMAVAYLFLIIYYSHKDNEKYKIYRKYACILISINYTYQLYNAHEIDYKIFAVIGYLLIAHDHYFGNYSLFLYFILSCLQSIGTKDIKSGIGLVGDFLLAVYYGKSLQ